MAAGRFVVLGLAHARSPWFRQVASWSNSASIPVEFVKCMSAVELRAHLASGRPFSAVVIDGSLPALDRDLVDSARQAACAVVVVDDLRVTRDWLGLGASAVINPMFERKDLLDVLAAHTAEIGRGDAVPGDDDDLPPSGWRASVAMVCGAGGTGASSAAIALAQGLADDLRFGGMVLLADLALNGEQAMLHDARDVVPGIQEVVDAHRQARPAVDELRAFVFAVHERRYDLLLGLRRTRNWPSIRPRAFAAALEGLTRGWRAIVCDVSADLEGESDGGSIEVEERNTMARAVAARADVVFAVGLPDMKGVHSLVRVVGELLDHGVPSSRIVPVFNRAPKSVRSRTELSSALASLLDRRLESAPLCGAVFLPDRRVDEALRDGVRLSSALSAPIASAFSSALDRATDPRALEDLRPVAPGSLGRWSADITAEPA
jgi:hypothetical protein